MSKVRLYILCHTDEKYESAKKIYQKFSWAHPIRMKYQDCTFENAFWQQLAEIYEEWRDLEMVGTLSFSAHAKIDLSLVDEIIQNKVYNPLYFHFKSTPVLVEDSVDARGHPHLLEIWSDTLKVLGLETTNECFSNYWMCAPVLMNGFLTWYFLEALPAVIRHPLAFTDAKYSGTLKDSELISLWGEPYYPHVPFIFERLNKCFFDKVIKGILNL